MITNDTCYYELLDAAKQLPTPQSTAIALAKNALQ
jgi:hypothetical protein